MYQGSCLCGDIRFEFDRFEGDFVYCHCRSCRKASGSAFGANIAVPVDAFRLTTGEALLGTYESSPGKVRHFCSRCGSPLFNRVEGAEHLRVRLGSVDTDIRQGPKAHIFLGHRADWDRPSDDLDGYEEWPDFSKVKIAGTTKRD
ncbi:GFA family protein [Saccharospirillum salsuginis]|uniref:Aldehyde-activating protein n=1 Tax=Saccharospirillum salsuginis TaxID=418750 RepID=A0A918KTJ5_9GAMM|nr:GFA family protein [Saccharospirillum salsuginis]GGX72998.1 aldehyde-activating protein [Saccharospirillum salsuginis]